MLIAAYMVTGFLLASVYAVGLPPWPARRYVRLGFAIPFIVRPRSRRRSRSPSATSRRARPLRRPAGQVRGDGTDHDDRSTPAGDGRRGPRRRPGHRWAAAIPDLSSLAGGVRHEHRRSPGSTRSRSTSGRPRRSCTSPGTRWSGSGRRSSSSARGHSCSARRRRDHATSRWFLRTRRWPGSARSWPSSRAGSSPRSVASRGSCTAVLRTSDAVTPGRRRPGHVHRGGRPVRRSGHRDAVRPAHPGPSLGTGRRRGRRPRPLEPATARARSPTGRIGRMTGPIEPTTATERRRGRPMTTADLTAVMRPGSGLTVYAVFGGADFGAGFWDLTAGGRERGTAPRALIAEAIGPVWEANHTWLIFDHRHPVDRLPARVRRDHVDPVRAAQSRGARDRPARRGLRLPPDRVQTWPAGARPAPSSRSRPWSPRSSWARRSGRSCPAACRSAMPPADPIGELDQPDIDLRRSPRDHDLRVSRGGLPRGRCPTPLRDATWPPTSCAARRSRRSSPAACHSAASLVLRWTRRTSSTSC